MNELQISSKLGEICIEELAHEHDFILRSDGKITGLSFVLSFFVMLSKGKHTLRSWAVGIYMFSGIEVSSKAIQGRLQFRHEAFAQAFLASALSTQLKQALGFGRVLRHGEHFNRVLVEDSICVKLPRNLYDFFPGPHSRTKGQSATARIQARIDLKTGSYEHLDLQSFRDNDQKFSPDIIQDLHKGDLVLRDMGYWSLEVFEQIDNKGAFLITRYRYGTCIFEENATAQAVPIDLLAMLKNKQKQGITKIDMQVQVGKKKRFKMRLIAVKVPQAVEQKRRRKAAKNRNKSANHSKEYMQLLGWTIMLTNIPVDMLEAQLILDIYTYRWRVENIFKCWKSAGTNMNQLFANKQQLTPARVRICFWLVLAFLILFFVRWFQYFEQRIAKANKCLISIFKFIDIVMQYFERFLNATDLDEFTDLIARHCKYDKRKDRTNMMQKLYVLI